eukprot:1693336-Amphidinium_carterae.1
MRSCASAKVRTSLSSLLLSCSACCACTVCHKKARSKDDKVAHCCSLSPVDPYLCPDLCGGRGDWREGFGGVPALPACQPVAQHWKSHSHPLV